MRPPAVAGQFYEGERENLIAQIENCYLHRVGPGRLPRLREGKRTLRGLVCPHAGYVYSGPVAVHSYAALAEDGWPETFVVLGPNHSGMGAAVALGTQDFETPLGVARVDRELAKRLLKDVLYEDMAAHRFEHSIEVQLPFLQHLREDVKFVPICMMDQELGTAKKVGQIIRDAIQGREVVVIASTDFSHYLPKDVAAKKDRLAIEQIVKMDARGLYQTIRKNDISMCGYGPVIAMMTAAEGGRAQLLRYASSGDVSPMREVVGYGSFAIRA
jgi:AmmeMemoRadiSam system protein B